MFQEFENHLNQLTDEVIPLILTTAIDKTLLEMQKNIRSKAPTNTGEYRESISVQKAEQKDDIITGKVYSNQKIGGTHPKWMNVALGILLERGTGPKGKATVDPRAAFEGLKYRDGKWCFYWKEKNRWVTTDGMPARHHFLPALLESEELLEQNIVKEWNSKI